jgi:hypothetical protein
MDHEGAQVFEAVDRRPALTRRVREIVETFSATAIASLLRREGNRARTTTARCGLVSKTACKRSCKGSAAGAALMGPNGYQIFLRGR